MSYTSQVTFLYFSDLEEGKRFFKEVLRLEMVYEPDWAAVYKVCGGSYLGAVDAKRGSVASAVRGGFLVSLTVDDVMPYYERLKEDAQVKDLSGIKVFDDIGVKSFFFKGPEGYDFEIQQFVSEAYDFSKV
jgi:catechol 2,3-dioxygenase-like lactoylglutathione lyase family enzyme